MVELPITLVQDHTLWEILREETIDRWTQKSDWIAANGHLKVTEMVVTQSSDAAFHCVTITVFYWEPPAKR